MYLVFTRMPGESYHGWLRSLLLFLCYVFQALISTNELPCVLILHMCSGPRSVSDLSQLQAVTRPAKLQEAPRTYLSFKHWLVLSVIDRCVNCIHAVWPLWGPLKFFHTKQNSYCADKRIYVFIFLAGTAARQSTMLQWHQWRNVQKKKKKKKQKKKKGTTTIFKLKHDT